MLQETRDVDAAMDEAVVAAVEQKKQRKCSQSTDTIVDNNSVQGIVTSADGNIYDTDKNVLANKEELYNIESVVTSGTSCDTPEAQDGVRRGDTLNETGLEEGEQGRVGGYPVAQPRSRKTRMHQWLLDRASQGDDDALYAVRASHLVLSLSIALLLLIQVLLYTVKAL